MSLLIYTYVVNKLLHVIKVATVRIMIFVANALLTRWLQTIRIFSMWFISQPCLLIIIIFGNIVICYMHFPIHGKEKQHTYINQEIINYVGKYFF